MAVSASSTRFVSQCLTLCVGCIWGLCLVGAIQFWRRLCLS